MDEKKEKTFQSSEDSLEKSESETQFTSSTDEDSHLEEEKTSEEDIFAEKSTKPSTESSSTIMDKQATELEEETPASAIEETETKEEEKPVSAIEETETKEEETPVSAIEETETKEEEAPVSAIEETEIKEEETPVPAIEETEIKEEETPVSEEEIKTLEEKPEPVREKIPPPPKEIVIVEETKKTRDKIIKKIKRTSLIVFLIIGLILIGGVYAWTSGMNDLREDNDYLIVVVFKEAEAASIYHKDTGESEVIEVTELEKIVERERFFNSAQKKYGVLDRMIIIDVDTLKALSTDDYILYQNDPEKRIYRDEMYDWIIGKDFPRPEIQGNDSPSVVNAKMLKSWLDHYQEKLFGHWGSNTVKVVLNGYRSEKIIIHPGNSALFILKYIAVEKIFLPV